MKLANKSHFNIMENLSDLYDDVELYIEDTDKKYISSIDGINFQYKKENYQGIGIRIKNKGKDNFFWYQNTSDKYIINDIKGKLRSASYIKDQHNIKIEESITTVDWDTNIKLLSDSFEYHKSKKNNCDLKVDYFEKNHNFMLMRRNCESQYSYNNLKRLTHTIMTSNSSSALFSPGVSGKHTRLDVKNTYDEASRIASNRYNAKAISSSRENIMFVNGTGGLLFHEIIGHMLEADMSNLLKSPYYKKIGEMIIDESITLIDNPLLEGAWGSYEYDDEGNKSEKKIIVKNGVLMKYFLDRESSKILGLGESNNARKMNFSYMAKPRMSNIYVESENSGAPNMIINNLYVKQITI